MIRFASAASARAPVRGSLLLATALACLLTLPGCAQAGSSVATAPATPSATPAPAGPGPFDEGLALLAAHDDAAALPKLEQALEADPDSLRAASEYRQAVIRLGDYDRALTFFEALAGAHPESSAVELDWGYALVDKIPAQGAVTRVILADGALHHFTRSLELKKTWIGLYTRGNSYLYWPKVFHRTPLAVADLEEAMAMPATQEPRHVYARGFVALGDAYWQSDLKDKARGTWQEGLRRFAGDARLSARLGKTDEQVDAYLYEQLDPNLRVDTNLAELWANE